MASAAAPPRPALPHAVNERISGVMAGLIGLIAKGYGTLTAAFIAVYVVPILTLGALKIRGQPVQVMAQTPLPHPPSGP